MTTTTDYPTECPNCHHKYFFTSAAKRPNPRCPKCKTKYYIKSSKSSEPQKNPDPPEDKTVLNPPLNASGDGSGHLTPDMIEQAIMIAMKRDPTNTQIIRAAVDFYSKIRSSEEETKEVDIEKLYLIGVDNPDS